MWRLSFVASLEEAENFAARLEEFCLAVSWFEMDSSDASTHMWQVEATFEKQPDGEWLKALLGTLPLPYELAPLPEIDWLTENRSSFPVLDIGPFYIYGSHHEDAVVVPEDKIALKIDAATAFGTGQHGTTQGCLLALNDLRKEGMLVRRHLDLGCGTAVLGMAMVRLFGVRGVAADNDSEAVERACSNIRENKLENLLKVFLSEGFSDQTLRSQGSSYDLIAANILADSLIMLVSDIARFTTPEGRVVLSGILQTQEHEVVKAYEDKGFFLQQAYPVDEWITLVMKKKREE